MNTKHSKITTALFATAALLGWSQTASADDGRQLSSIPSDLRIVGGESSKTCSFPSAVQIKRRGRMHCTGTLVHPEIVTTANHCLGGGLTASFGERGEHQNISMDCKGFRGGGDMAYCKLSQPVNDVPIVPILMGCELDALKKGVDIALVGFGNSSNQAGDAGIKREVITPIHSDMGEGQGVADVEILLGHRQKGSCNGDSGGPAFVDLRTIDAFKDKPGAGWRSFGITSRKGPGGGNCASSTVYGVTAKIVEWIEQDSGIDVTPCFDADGTWNPGPECGGFPDPQAGGSWPQCDAGKVSVPSQTCGENGAGGDKEDDGDKDKEDDKDDGEKDKEDDGDKDKEDDKDDGEKDKEDDKDDGDKDKEDDKDDGEKDKEDDGEKDKEDDKDDGDKDKEDDKDDGEKDKEDEGGDKDKEDDKGDGDKDKDKEDDKGDGKDKEDDKGDGKDKEDGKGDGKDKEEDDKGGCSVQAQSGWQGLMALCLAPALGLLRRRRR